MASGHRPDQTTLGRVCIVIPTYNEAPNVTPLLTRLTDLHGDCAILVVDDDSPDGTGRLVRDFAAAHPQVHLLEGPRRGLGQAYVRGMVHALTVLDADVVVQMDADFSHDPGDVQRLLACLAEGADVAIGSRYVPGGAVDERWSLGRRLLSRWGNRFARWIGGVRGVRDCTAGFRAVRSDVLRAADVQALGVRGYVFLVALLHRLLHVGARVVEQPILFREREHGVTKLSGRDALEFLFHVWLLRLASHRTFIRSCLTGLSGVLVNLGSFQIMLEFGLHELVASPIAIELAIISNFLINRRWTFSDRVAVGRKRIHGLKYQFVALGTLVLSYAVFASLSALFPDALPVLLQAAAIAPAALLNNYFASSYWTFREDEGPCSSSGD